MIIASPFLLSTPLGPTALQFLSLSAREEMARPFEFLVRAVGDPASPPDLAALLSKPATVSMRLPDDSQRHFSGLVAAAGLDGFSGKLPVYRLVLRPWLWLLTRRADTRIFQNLDLEAILKKVFEPYGGEVAFEQQGPLPTYPYCVQYRESDFNFVSRLLEQEGLYYYFRHGEGTHQLVIANTMSAHKPYPGHAELAYRDSAQAAALDFDGVVSDWRSELELQPAKFSLNDYNFETPTTSMLAQAPGTLSPAPPGFLEIYDPPGEYPTPSDGQRYAKLRMEELEAQHLRVSASALARGVAAGHVFTLTEHPVDSENVKHLVLGTHIEAQYGGYEAGQGGLQFSCRFSAMRQGSPYRPARSTPKPSVAGPQTARVVGPSGEEIHTDEHGRVKVQFHWDRLGKKDENSSCWLRVATQFAGKGFGMISLPRIGQEVVVGFLEGDPDRPLILGSVYNAEQIPPYALPDNKTVSTLRTQSSSGATRGHFNEIALEDKAGQEYIRLHAQKDLVEQIVNDAHQRVGNNQFREVGKSLTESFGENVSRSIAETFTDTVGKEMHLTVGENATWDVGQNLAFSIGQNTSLATGTTLSLDVGSTADVKVGANLGLEAGANLHIKAGANLTIEAGGTLTLKGAMVHIEGSGPVSVKGAVVLINSGGAGAPGAGAKPKKPEKPKAADKPEALGKKVTAVEDGLKVKR